MARIQTLVQLTDELIEILDRRAADQGVSRSALVRELLTEALAADRGAELSRRMIDGYGRSPQQTAEDAWGDLDVWTDANTRRNRAALVAEEDSSW